MRPFSSRMFMLRGIVRILRLTSCPDRMPHWNRGPYPGMTRPSDAETVMTVTLDPRPTQDQETIPDTMRAAVLYGPKDIRQIDRPVPRPGAGEVLVKVAMCGTCGTDLKIYDGHFPLTLPYGAFTPGHEWTGTVVALGE